MPEIRAAIYIRVSRTDQADNGTSLDSQLRLCREYAAKRGYTVVAEYADDHTGFDTSRPGINEIKMLARSREIDIVVCYTQDRFARDLAFVPMADEFVRQYKVALDFVCDGMLDLSTFAGKITAVIKALASGDEAMKIRERSMRGKREAHMENRVLAFGKIRYGYKSVGTQGSRKRDLAINHDIISDIPGLETEPDVVLWIFDRFINHRYGISQLAHELNSLGIRFSGGVKWTTLAIRRTISYQQYTGCFIRHKYLFEDTEERNAKGKRKKRVDVRPQEEWVMIYREDLAIISEELYDAGQNKLAKTRGRVGRTYMLTRYIECEHGHSRCGHTVKNRWQYYTLDGNRYRKSRCSCKNEIRCGLIDGAVWEWVVQLIVDPERVLSAYQALQQDQIESKAEDIDTLQRFDDSIREAEEELQYLMDEAREHRKIARLRDHYRDMIKTQTTKLDALVAERNRLALPLEDSVISDAQIATTVEALEELVVDVEALYDLSLSEKKKIIELLDLRIVTFVDPTYIDIIWCGVADRIAMKNPSQGS